MWNQANNPFLKALLSVLGMVVLAMALVLPYMTLPLLALSVLFSLCLLKALLPRFYSIKIRIQKLQ